MIDHYKKTKPMYPDVRIAINLGTRVTLFLEHPKIVDEDKEIDLAIIEWDELEKWAYHNKRYFPIVTWPIPVPKKGDPITVVGFPGALRKTTDDMGSFSPYGLGMIVRNEPANNIWLVSESGTLHTRIKGMISNQSIDLGGLSGSPGLFFQNGRFHLAGLVYECSERADMVVLNIASRIRRDGTISKD